MFHCTLGYRTLWSTQFGFKLRPKQLTFAAPPGLLTPLLNSDLVGLSGSRSRIEISVLCLWNVRGSFSDFIGEIGSGSGLTGSIGSPFRVNLQSLIVGSSAFSTLTLNGEHLSDIALSCLCSGVVCWGDFSSSILTGGVESLLGWSETIFGSSFFNFASIFFCSLRLILHNFILISSVVRVNASFFFYWIMLYLTQKTFSHIGIWGLNWS